MTEKTTKNHCKFARFKEDPGMANEGDFICILDETMCPVEIDQTNWNICADASLIFLKEGEKFPEFGDTAYGKTHQSKTTMSIQDPIEVATKMAKIMPALSNILRVPFVKGHPIEEIIILFEAWSAMMKENGIAPHFSKWKDVGEWMQKFVNDEIRKELDTKQEIKFSQMITNGNQ